MAETHFFMNASANLRDRGDRCGFLIFDEFYVSGDDCSKDGDEGGATALMISMGTLTITATAANAATYHFWRNCNGARCGNSHDYSGVVVSRI